MHESSDPSNRYVDYRLRVESSTHHVPAFPWTADAIGRKGIPVKENLGEEGNFVGRTWMPTALQ